MYNFSNGRSTWWLYDTSIDRSIELICPVLLTTLLFFAVCLICYAHACTGVPCAHTCCGSATYGSEYYHNHSYRSLKLPGADVARAFNGFTSRLHIDGVVAHTHTHASKHHVRNPDAMVQVLVLILILISAALGSACRSLPSVHTNVLSYRVPGLLSHTLDSSPST